jgi:hypothetical protein
LSSLEFTSFYEIVLFMSQLSPTHNKVGRGIESVFKSLDGVLKELAEDEPKKPLLALPAPQ